MFEHQFLLKHDNKKIYLINEMETISQITNAGKSYVCETSMLSAYKRICVLMLFILITYSLFILYKLHFLKFLLCIMYIC